MIVIKNISMTLDKGSINNAIREVRLIRDKLVPAMRHLIEYLAEKGVEIAKAELVLFDKPAYWSGALQDSIQYRMENDKEAVITAGEGLEDGYEDPGSYAIYVEYGTGIYGADINNHGFDGWYYPAPWGTWIPETGKHAGEKMAWTNGMEPRPFMLHTLNDLEDEARVAGGRIVAEYLKEM